MHTLIISGSPWCPLQQAQTLLEQAGLQPAQPATTSSISNMAVWYDRLFVGTPHLASAQQPGKPWELAAGEIFLANWDQPAWGWADSRSTWLLDFWRQFDPSTRFVLLHTPAYDVLAQALADTDSGDFDSKALLDTWCTYQTELLRFYHRNRAHCVLAHAHLALQQPNEWVQTLNAALGTSLTPTIATSWELQQPDPLQHLLVQRILQDHPEVQALEDEINATLPSVAAPAATLFAPDPAAASATLRQLYLTQADLQQDCKALLQFQAKQTQEISVLEDSLTQKISYLTQELDTQQQAANLAIAQCQALANDKVALTVALDAQVQAQSEALAQRDAELHAKTEALAQRDAQTQALKDQQQESELLLLQLHQVQEELEQHFLAGQELKSQIAASQKIHDQLNKDKAAITAARDAEAKAKSEAVAQCDALAKEKADLTAARDAESKAKTEVIAQRDVLAKEKTALTAARDAEFTAKQEALAQHATQAQALKDQQQESELLLLQLHQVQEELEQHFLAGQELKTQIAASQKAQDQLNKDKVAVTAARDAETKAKTEALAQRDALTKDKAALTASRDAEAKLKAEAIAQCDALAKEKAALTAARDAELKAKTEALAQRDALTKDKAALTAARDAESKAKTDAITQRDAEAKAKADAQAQRDALAKEKSALTAAQASQAQALKDQQQESELLLLQLHQVQEELEHYFLQHQQANQEKQALDTRLTKLLQRYPDYTEWDRIELVPTSATKTQLHCQIHGLRAGTRTAPLLDLTVAIVDKHPVLQLTAPATPANNPLLYWPTAPAENAEAGQGASLVTPLQLDPAAAPGTVAGQHLRSLTQSDLQLLAAACKALSEGLPTTMPQRKQWVQHLGTLAQQFSTLPPVWRFDAVQLKHQQVNPDYEHLWFELSNASFGSRHWPRFEFRLSAANIKKSKFSQHPKLEFPQQAQGDPQFENWFEESEDDRGPKFELRFDTKTQGLDLNAWRALSPTDQAQALSLGAQLPVLLQRLQTQGTPIARPWSDWQGMTTAIQQAFVHCLRAPANQAVAA